MRYMYDSVNARSILAVDPNPEMVAGYSDTIKIPQWTTADWNLFPRATKVHIVKKASSNWGHVLDVEPGDATPAQAPGWVTMRRRAGSIPTIYCNLSTWPVVRNEFIVQHVPEPIYWIAKYDGDPKIPDSWVAMGCVAKQYHGNDPRNYDKSSVLDYWPGVDQKEEDVNEDQNAKLNALFDAVCVMKTTKVPNSAAAYPLGDYVRFNNANLYKMTTETLPALQVGLNAALAALEKVTGDPNITAENLKAWIQESVSQHLQITGDIKITGE